MKNEKITSEEVRKVFLWEGWGLKEFFLLMRGEAMLLATGVAMAGLTARCETGSLAERVKADFPEMPASGICRYAVPATGELWGNFPQTYSMVGIIHCARKLSRSWEEGLWHVS